MSFSLDQILPSLQSFGTLGYWLIGAASALEAFFLTGIVVPGTLIVDAGGILVQRGLLDFFDLVWFVAIGSVLGSEVGYHVGRLARRRLSEEGRIARSRAFRRAERLFERRGGMALVLGRFMGPVSGLVPLAAALAGMERRTFLIWNIAGSLPYAFAHVTLGYLMGDMAGRLGGGMTRLALLAAVVLLLLVVLWGILYSALRLLPVAVQVLLALGRSLATRPAIARLLAAYPGVTDWIAARFERHAFSGLPLTLLSVVFVYVGIVWLDTVVDFVSGSPMLQLDQRLAELIHNFQAPVPIRIATWASAIGTWKVIVALTLAGALWLVSRGHRPLAEGLVVAVAGNAASVAVLKMIFQRPRSPLGYFVESSNSFPSGHAAVSVAFYGMAFYVLWKLSRLRVETALLAAGLVALGIGLSRIYLIEHYLTDVLSGWLVGGLWLLIGMAVAEWRQSAEGRGRAARARVRHGAAAVSLALVAVAGWAAWSYDHPRNGPVAPLADRVVSAPGDLAQAKDFPAGTQSLLGSPLLDVNLVVLARDEASLRDALGHAGWQAARPITLGGVLDAGWASVSGDKDPTARFVSHFWRGQPDKVDYVDPKEITVHARFWPSEYVTPEGLRVWAGTVGPEAPGGTSAGTARDPLVTALEGAGATIVTRIDLHGAAPGAAKAGARAIVLKLR